jgi:hypothetical protein
MAFEAFGLVVGRGDIFNISSDFSSSINIYKSPYDMMGVITSADYFPPYLGKDNKTIVIGDILYVQDKILKTQCFVITNVDPITVTPLFGFSAFDQDLNTYNDVTFNSVTTTTLGSNIIETELLSSASAVSNELIANTTFTIGSAVLTPPISISMDFSGPFDPPLSGFCTLVKFGGFVTLYIPQLINAAPNFGNISLAAGSLPIGYRPAIHTETFLILILARTNLVTQTTQNYSSICEVFQNGGMTIYGSLTKQQFYPSDIAHPVGSYAMLLTYKI